MKHLPSRNAMLGVLGSTAALSALIAVALARGGSGAPPPSPTTTQADNTSAGMVVARDAETGALRAPTAEEMAELRPNSAKLQQSKKSVSVVRQLPDGAIAITLDSSFEVYSVAARGTDGKIQTACVPADKVEATLEAAQKGGLTKKEVLDEK